LLLEDKRAKARADDAAALFHAALAATATKSCGFFSPYEKDATNFCCCDAVRALLRRAAHARKMPAGVPAHGKRAEYRTATAFCRTPGLRFGDRRGRPVVPQARANNARTGLTEETYGRGNRRPIQEEERSTILIPATSSPTRSRAIIVETARGTDHPTTIRGGTVAMPNRDVPSRRSCARSKGGAARDQKGPGPMAENKRAEANAFETRQKKIAEARGK
jgi:hypothetical protein